MSEITTEALAGLQTRMARQKQAREATAKAICNACGENPDHRGDAQGNEFRWQDYLAVADAAIKAMQCHGYVQL